MNKKPLNLSLWLPLSIASLIGLCLAVISCNKSEAEEGAAEAATNKPLKVLYVTQDNCPYHNYPQQKEEFNKIASTQKHWDVTVLSNNGDALIQHLATNPEFAKGYDVVIYNFCLANSDNLEAPYNIIQQTRKLGVPALLIHGALHSFWPTFKENGPESVQVEGQSEKVRTRKNLLELWNKNHAGEPFPVWPSLTGIGSTAHGPHDFINVKKIKADHEILKGFNEYQTVKVAELYNNYINETEAKTTIPVLKGIQGQAEAVVLWEFPLGTSKAVGFTLGHSVEAWHQEEFQRIIINSVNYLGKGK